MRVGCPRSQDGPPEKLNGGRVARAPRLRAVVQNSSGAPPSVQQDDEARVAGGGIDQGLAPAAGWALHWRAFPLQGGLQWPRAGPYSPWTAQYGPDLRRGHPRPNALHRLPVVPL